MLKGQRKIKKLLIINVMIVVTFEEKGDNIILTIIKKGIVSLFRCPDVCSILVYEVVHIVLFLMCVIFQK